jgi:two-component system CheB/CheR fusion protein
MEPFRPNFVVGIGGSAGSLIAFKALLDSLPFQTGMAFVIIAHLMPSASSQLVKILSRHTKMKVKLASTAMPIQANHVYVIPPNADLTVEGYTFKIVSPRVTRNNQIDLFFTSLANSLEAKAIGVVLSGYDGDGAVGCKQIKTKGGITFAQDKSAEVDVMPISAQESGFIDFVLSAEKISAELKKIGSKVRRDR